MRSLAVIGALVLLAACSGGKEDDAEPESEALLHARYACEWTAKADEAAAVRSSERIAAAVILLDTAILESTRAAQEDKSFTELDEAVQAVHTAGHRGTAGAWEEAMDAALSVCRVAAG